MIAGRSEIVDIFRRWASDRAPIRWQGTFAPFAFTSWGIIVFVDDLEVRLADRDMKSELVVRFKDVIEFDYADSRSITGREKQFEECVIMRFSDTADEKGTPDLIALGALDSLSATSFSQA